MKWYRHYDDTGYEFENCRIKGVELECSNCLAEYKSLRELIDHTAICDGLNWDAARLRKFRECLPGHILSGAHNIMFSYYQAFTSPISFGTYKNIMEVFAPWEQCLEEVQTEPGVTYADIQRSTEVHWNGGASFRDIKA